MTRPTVRPAVCEEDAQGEGGRHTDVALAAATASSMALAFAVPFTLGVLGPVLVEDLALADSAVGVLVAASFAVATLASPAAGRAVDTLPTRQLLVGLVAWCALTSALVSVAPSFTWLLVCVGLGGIAQAGANPVTNRLIGDLVPKARRGLVMGFKQSGVQVGSFLAGLVLPGAAVLWGWRGSLRLVSVAAITVAGLVWWAIPAGAGTRRRGRRDWQVSLGSPPLRRLMAYVFLMGGGVAAIVAYLPLYAHAELGLGEAPAGALVAVLGATGIAARIGWARQASRTGEVSRLLAGLAVTAVLAAVLVALAPELGTWSLWLAALVLGASAVAQQSVAMLAVVDLGTGRTGQDSALASMAFFAGFVASPLAFGALVDTSSSYVGPWLFVAAQFALAALTLTRGARR